MRGSKQVGSPVNIILFFANNGAISIWISLIVFPMCALEP